MKRAVFFVGLGVLLAVAQSPAVAQDWVNVFQDTGTWTPTPIPTDGDQALGQTFTVTQGLQGIGFQSPTWAGTGGGYRLRLFAWNTDYATSIAGTVLGELTETDHPDNAWVDLVLDPVLAPGQYLAVTDQPVRGDGNIGHWGWSSSSAAGGAVPGAYSNGTLVSGMEFQIRVAEAEFVGSSGGVEFNFDCGRDEWYAGWAGANPGSSLVLTSAPGVVKVTWRQEGDLPATQAITDAGGWDALGWDPMMTTRNGVSIDADANPEFAMQMDVTGLAAGSYTGALFWFGGAGHGRAGFSFANGANTIRFNIPATKDSGDQDWTGTVSPLRLDIPDGHDFATFQNAEATIDWIVFSDDPSYVPEQNDCAAVAVHVMAAEFDPTTQGTNGWSYQYYDEGAGEYVDLDNAAEGFGGHYGWNIGAFVPLIGTTGHTYGYTLWHSGAGSPNPRTHCAAVWTAPADGIVNVDSRSNAAKHNASDGGALLIRVLHNTTEIFSSPVGGTDNVGVRTLVAAPVTVVAGDRIVFQEEISSDSTDNSWSTWDPVVKFQPTGAPEGLVLTFDCGRDGFTPNGSSTLTDNIGSITFVPTAGDPFMTRDNAIDGTAFEELAMQLNVASAANDSFPAAFFWFADGGHGRAGFQLAGDGDYTIRMNVPAAKDSGAANWDASIYRIRLDFPDGDATAFINAGTMFTLDWLTITADPNYTPGATDLDAIDCDGDGLSNGYEEALGTDPFDADSDDDGVNDGLEVQFGTDPLDPESVPVIPVTSGIGLAAAALALALAGLVLVRRRRIA